MATDEETFRERMAISADVGEILFEHFCDKIGTTLDLRSGKFRVLYQEECVELGYPGDDDPYGPLVIRREADGQCFEVELDAHISAVPTPEEREANRKLYAQMMERVSGQQILPLGGAS